MRKIIYHNGKMKTLNKNIEHKKNNLIDHFLGEKMQIQQFETAIAQLLNKTVNCHFKTQLSFCQDSSCG